MREASVTLFIIFHESTGHLKTHVNNITSSPHHCHNEDLILHSVEMDTPDSGFLLEYLLSDNFIEVEYFINSEQSKLLLDEKIYLENDFKRIREILGSIKNALTPIKNNSKKDEDDEINKTKKEIDENDFVSNYRNKTFTQLFAFFSRLSEEEKQKYKEKDVYKYYKSFYDDDDGDRKI